MIVTDPERRRKLAELVGEGFYTERGFDPWISEAPALFVPCVSAKVYVDRYNEPDKRDPAAPPGTEADWAVPYWWMDVGCTVMLILLAAVDEGLAGGFAGGDFDGIRAELGMPADFTHARRRDPRRPPARRQAVPVVAARLARDRRVRPLGSLGRARDRPDRRISDPAAAAFGPPLRVSGESRAEPLIRLPRPRVPLPTPPPT